MYELNTTEKRVLNNLHLLGYMGRCGSLTKKQRTVLLQSLIQRGYLTENCKLTKKGINASIFKRGGN